MKGAAIAAAAALALVGMWKLARRGPADITEAEAKALADKQLDVFCDTLLKPLPIPPPGKPGAGTPAVPGSGAPGAPGPGGPGIPGAGAPAAPEAGAPGTPGPGGFLVPGLESAHCSDFKLTGKVGPTSRRYFWAWAYEDVKVQPAERVLVMIGRKGEAAFEVSQFAPEPEKKAAAVAANGPQPSPAAAAATKVSVSRPPAIGLSQAPTPKPAEAATAWTLCELPPAGP